MTIQQAKNAFAAIYRKACINGELTKIDQKNLETIKDEVSDIQDGALNDGDTSLWNEMFELTAEIDSLLGIDYSAENMAFAGE